MMSKKCVFHENAALSQGLRPKSKAKNETGHLRLFRVEDKCGFMDEHCSVIIPPRFDMAGDFVNGLAPVIVDFETGKFGYINKNGEYEIAPQFDVAENFSEGLAAVKISERWGYIDSSGKIAIPARFLFALSFSEGLAPVYDNASIPDNDEEHQRHIESIKCYRDHRNQTLLADRYLIRWGYIDKKGNYVISPQCWSISDFVDGIAAVRFGPFDKFGFINTEGKFVIDPSFSYACSQRSPGTCKWAVQGIEGIEYAAYEGVTVQDFIKIVKTLQATGRVQDNIGNGWIITKRIELRKDGDIKVKRIPIYDSTVG